MHRILEYTIFFTALLLLQVFLFNNLNLSVFINPLVYVAFIVLLPMETRAVVMLLLGLVMGVSVDLMMGTAGLNTLATLFTAFTRRPVMMLMIGKETVGEGGIPGSGVLGTGKFLRYSTVVVLIQCIVLFTFETLNFSYFHYTLLKISLSAALTVGLVYFAQMLLIGTYAKKKF